MVKNIDYQFDFMPSESVSILLDQNKIEKIINNLLANAIKFTPKNGQVRISFEISNSKASDTYLYIKVKDSGRGIPQEDIPYIFDRYFQSKNNTVLEGGTGIGLALTKELIELMNGQIAVQSKVKEGTLFDIKLPVVLVEENIIVEENVEISSLVGFQRLDDLGQAPSFNRKRYYSSSRRQSIFARIHSIYSSAILQCNSNRQWSRSIKTVGSWPQSVSREQRSTANCQLPTNTLRCHDA